MSKLKIMGRPHPSVSLSVCHAVSENNQFEICSWKSVLDFCIKLYQARELFVKSDSMPSVLYWKDSMNFYLRLPYLLMDLCELGTEILHITPFCKYQINQNRSSGSHTAIQRVEVKIRYFSKFFPRSKHNPLQNRFTTICWVTVSFIKIGSLKNILFLRGGGTSLCGVSTLFHFYACVLYLKMFEWNHRNMLCLKQPNERAVFRCCVCVDLNGYWNTYWTDCVTEFGLVHSELFALFVCNSMWAICTFCCFCRPLYYRPHKDLQLMSSTHCQSPVLPYSHIPHQAASQNSKPCAWFRPFQTTI